MLCSLHLDVAQLGGGIEYLNKEVLIITELDRFMMENVPDL